MSIENLRELLKCCLPGRQLYINLHMLDIPESNYRFETRISSKGTNYNPKLKNCYTHYNFNVSARNLLLTHMEVENKIKRFFVPLGNNKAALITRTEYVKIECVEWGDKFLKGKESILEASNESLLDIFVKEKFLRKVKRVHLEHILLSKYHVEGIREALFEFIPYNQSILWHRQFYRDFCYDIKFCDSLKDTVDYQFQKIFPKEVVKYIEDTFENPYNWKEIAKEIFRVNFMNEELFKYYLFMYISPYYVEDFLYTKKWLNILPTVAERKYFFLKQEYPLSKLFWDIWPKEDLKFVEFRV